MLSDKTRMVFVGVISGLFLGIVAAQAKAIYDLSILNREMAAFNEMVSADIKRIDADLRERRKWLADFDRRAGHKQ